MCEGSGGVEGEERVVHVGKGAAVLSQMWVCLKKFVDRD